VSRPRAASKVRTSTLRRRQRPLLYMRQWYVRLLHHQGRPHGEVLHHPGDELGDGHADIVTEGVQQFVRHVMQLYPLHPGGGGHGQVAAGTVEGNLPDPGVLYLAVLAVLHPDEVGNAPVPGHGGETA